MADLIPQLRRTLPAVVQDAGEETADRVFEFFTAEIRNPNTREAYARAVRRFFRWAARKGLDLSNIEPVHVAAYVEEDDRAPATVKQNLAARGHPRPSCAGAQGAVRTRTLQARPRRLGGPQRR